MIGPLWPATQNLGFMTAMPGSLAGIDVHLARSGYTGEDGFEISLAAAEVEALFEKLLSDDRASGRPRRPRHAAARGRALPLWPGYRREHEPDRGRPGLVDPARRRQALDFIGASGSRRSSKRARRDDGSGSPRDACRCTGRRSATPMETRWAW